MDVDIVLPDQRDEPLLPSSTSSTLNMWHDKGNRPMTVCLDEEIIHLEDAEHTQHIARPVDLNHLTQDKLEKAISSRRASLRHLVLLSNAYSASIGTDSALECRTGNAYDGEKATLIENENDRIALVKLQEQQWFDNLLETFAGDDLPSEEDSGLIITDLGENATTRTAMPETSDISSDYPSECLAAIDGFAAKRICGISQICFKPPPKYADFNVILRRPSPFVSNERNGRTIIIHSF